MKLWLRSVWMVLALASSAAAGGTDPFQMMDVNVVAQHLTDKATHIYDANSAKVYGEGHVPGASHVSFDEMTVAQLPASKADTLVFYCKNTMCMASHEAAKKASSFGYQHVYVMPAGIDGWKAAGKPVVKGVSAS